MKILEDHGLRVSESKAEYVFLPFSDPQAPSPDIMRKRKSYAEMQQLQIIDHKS